MDLTKESVQALLDAGKSMAAVNSFIDGDPYAVMPNGYKVESLAALRPPTRIKTNVRLDTPDAFATYVNRFKDEHTLIFAEVTDTGAKFVAVLDYHKAPARRGTEEAEIVETGAAPRYLSHVARFECMRTTEWERWMKANAQRMDQVQFATWLEDNQDLLANPTGAELLELVMTLEGKSDVRFNASVRLNSGKNALQYDEDVMLTSGGNNTKPGKIEVPQAIRAGIAPFHGVDKYEVNARLKYRIEARKLQFWFETVTPHRIVRDAVQGVVESVATQTKLMPLLGGLGS